ncbi:hypothetical protein I3200192J8_09230 [Faecalibacillus intestinalis]
MTNLFSNVNPLISIGSNKFLYWFIDISPHIIQTNGKIIKNNKTEIYITKKEYVLKTYS